MKKKSKKILGRRKLNFPPKRYNLNFVNNMNLPKKNNASNKTPTIGPSTLGNNNKNLNRNKKNIKENNNKNKNKDKQNKNGKNLNLLKKNNNVIITYNDYELNTFDYKNAMLHDKRTCFQYYLSLIKVKNPIIFSFCPN